MNLLSTLADIGIALSVLWLLYNTNRLDRRIDALDRDGR